MRKIGLLIAIILSHCFVGAQSENWVDSLLTFKENDIIVFESRCFGCLIAESPCDEYMDGVGILDRYVIWQNSKGCHIKKFNNCGSSKVLTVKNWKEDPFAILRLKSTEIDTTNLKYPLSLDTRDSIWTETGVEHYENYHISFPSYGIRKLEINDFAFREEEDIDDVMAKISLEFEVNQARYAYNNSTAIKELLDRLLRVVEESNPKLEVIKE